MQILFEKSEEGKSKGLGILKGSVSKFQKEKSPQMGWNYISSAGEIFDQNYAYFANSYYVNPKNEDIVLGKTEYGTVFPSIIKSENLTGVQFHPEKSGKYGLRFLKRWSEC